MRAMRPRRLEPRFNGAADLSPRKVRPRGAAIRRHRGLQWGRRPESAEGPRPLRAIEYLAELQWGRRPESADGRTRCAAQSAVERASMGPQT